MGNLVTDIGALAGDKGKFYTQRNTKNQALKRYIDEYIKGFGAERSAGQNTLNDYITKYLAGSADAQARATQESDVIGQFYNGSLAQKLAQLRASRAAAVNSAADLSVADTIRRLNSSRLGEGGGPSSYDTRLGISATAPIRAQAAIDNANAERSDLNYITNNELALTGQRQALQDAIAARGLVPYNLRRQNYAQDLGILGQLGEQDRANTFYGLRYEKPKSELAGNVTNDVIQAAMDIYTGGASGMLSGAMGGGGGGGGGGAGGLLSMFGSKGGGMNITDPSYHPDYSSTPITRFPSFGTSASAIPYSEGGVVHGPGTGTSDSVPIRASEGEFVVPAASLRIPGVLPLLQYIRHLGNRMSPTGTSTGNGYASGGVVYGDSYGGVQAAIQADENARQSAYEQAIGRAVIAAQNKRNFELQQRQIGDQESQFNTLTGERATDRATRNSEADRQYQLQQDYLKIAQEQSKDRIGDITPSQLREQNVNLAQAEADAAAGRFDPANYPTLPPTYHQVFQRRNQDARAAIENQYAVAANAAEILNKKAYNDQSIEMANKTFGFDDLTPPDAKTLSKRPPVYQKLYKIKQQYSELANRILSDKNTASEITFNPKTGKYEPAYAPPSWIQQQQQKQPFRLMPSVTSTATDTGAAPVVVPTAPPAQSRVNAPPVSTTGNASLYVPGKRYGNLRYAPVVSGGDPYDSRNWQQVAP